MRGIKYKTYTYLNRNLVDEDNKYHDKTPLYILEVFSKG